MKTITFILMRIIVFLVFSRKLFTFPRRMTSSVALRAMNASFLILTFTTLLYYYYYNINAETLIGQIEFEYLYVLTFTVYA